MLFRLANRGQTKRSAWHAAVGYRMNDCHDLKGTAMRAMKYVILLILAIACMVPGLSNAQYYVQSTGSVTGTCSSSGGQTTFHITAPGNMTLPASSNNLLIIGGDYVAPETHSSVAGTPIPSPIDWIVTGEPSAGNPVTLGLSLYPANNGTAAGTGFGTDLACADGDIFSATTPTGVSAELSAQYIAAYSGFAVGSCTNSNIQGTIDGAIFLPPPTSDNLVAHVSINGVPVDTQYVTVNPAAASGSQQFYYDFPGTTMPYSITGTVFPYRNGVSVGTGVTITYYCNEGVLSNSPPVAVGANSPRIPTLSASSLLILTVLMGLVSAWGIRGRLHA